jgi:hypothetical protein
MSNGSSIFNSKQKKASLSQMHVAKAQQALHVTIIGVCKRHLTPQLLHRFHSKIKKA